jgi:hypothetical protein
VIDALANKYVDSYLTCTSAKELWDVLDEKFGVSDAGSELYIMEQLFDYKIVILKIVYKKYMVISLFYVPYLHHEKSIYRRKSD